MLGRYLAGEGGRGPAQRRQQLTECAQRLLAEPVLVAEVAFTGWTRAGRMRAPSYQGLRNDKDPADVIREPLPGERSG